MNNAIRRRQFLGGAAVVIVTATGATTCFSQSPDFAHSGAGPQYEPWKTWREDSKNGPLVLVRAAILASNAFNAQPWLFKVTPTRIDLYADISRNLGLFDPYLRDMHLSLGCALENLMLAAAANVYRASLFLQPKRLALLSTDQTPQLVAQINLSPGELVSSDLYDAIPYRHTNRNLFDTRREFPPNFLEKLALLTSDEKRVKMFLFLAQHEREQLADTIETAARTNMNDSDVRAGIQPWFRTSEEQLQTLRDGEFVAQNTTKLQAPQPSYQQLLLSGRLFGILAVRDRYDQEQTLRAGRIWQRAHLLATTQGIAARPDNAAVERIDYERRLGLEPLQSARIAELTGDAQWQPTMMFYMGYPTIPATAAARRPVEDVELT
jgi:nitroreductase